MSRRAASIEPRFSVDTSYDVRIPTYDPDVTLSADIRRPVTDEPVPALITLLPYRKDHKGGSTSPSAHWFAERGYANVLVDITGIGSSDGLRRPEFDPSNGDDALAVIRWASGQPWCTGAIGMWGISYGAITTMRTASLQPPGLKAIIPVSHGLNPGTDTIHPDGARGDFHALANRGSAMLAQQLLPPLINYASPAEQQRWRRRLHETDPAFVDFARHSPTHPVWKDRAIRGEDILVPALCVGGWRDPFPGPLIEAFERMRGPKKLLVGPWGHVLPHESVHEPIDFLPMALRWWDHWLCGSDTGVMDEPAVTVWVEGDQPHWQSHSSWPPPHDVIELSTATGTTLAPEPVPARPSMSVIAIHRPDPIVGTLRGLPGLGMGESCLPQDQHDDDMRVVTATGHRLEQDITLVGRPEVAISLPPPDTSTGAPSRLIVRLCEVDDDGRSTLITTGALVPDDWSTPLRVILRPIAYHVPAGRRLRVAVGDADFPRLTPLPDPIPICVTNITLILPRIAAGSGNPVDLPPLVNPGTDSSGGPRPAAGLRWTVTRDPIDDQVTVDVTGRTPAPIVTLQGHRYTTSSHLRATVRRSTPEAATCSGTHQATVHLNSGEVIDVTATVRCTLSSLWAHGEVTIDDQPYFSRTWEIPLHPTGQDVTEPQV